MPIQAKLLFIELMEFIELIWIARQILAIDFNASKTSIDWDCAANQNKGKDVCRSTNGGKTDVGWMYRVDPDNKVSAGQNF